jgi:hypothetical protein
MNAIATLTTALFVGAGAPSMAQTMQMPLKVSAPAKTLKMRSSARSRTLPAPKAMAIEIGWFVLQMASSWDRKDPLRRG